MARYNKVDRRIWSDEKFRRLSPLKPSGQALWLFLLTAPFPSAPPGLLRVGEGAICDELGWDLKAFREAFAEAFAEGLVEADWKARLVWLPNAPRYNPPENPNVVTSWRVSWDELPECELKLKAYERLKAFAEGLPKAFGEAFAKACPKPCLKGMANPEARNPKPETRNTSTKEEGTGGGGSVDHAPVTEPSRDVTVALPELFPDAVPKPPTPDALLSAWNSSRGPLPEAKALTNGRKVHAKKRLSETPDLSRWTVAIQRIAASPFCRGENDRRWKADFDFLLSPDTLTKIEEGKYDARKTPPSSDFRKPFGAADFRYKSTGAKT